MKEYFGLLKTVDLFAGIDAADLASVLTCVCAEVKAVPKGEIVLLAGERPRHVGIVLAGRLHIFREDYDGARSLTAAIMPGGIFAEALCCAGVSESPVTVMADADSAVMLLRFSHILRTCQTSCSFHAKLIENMLGITAKKNLLLQSRMEIIGLKSVRRKVMRYLASFSPKPGLEFSIPFNREALADFLCVERSALSRELARMKEDGLIQYRKNKFILLGEEHP